MVLISRPMGTWKKIALVHMKLIQHCHCICLNAEPPGEEERNLPSFHDMRTQNRDHEGNPDVPTVACYTVKTHEQLNCLNFGRWNLCLPTQRPGFDSRRGHEFYFLFWYWACVLCLCSVLCRFWQWPWLVLTILSGRPAIIYLSSVLVHSLLFPLLPSDPRAFVL